MRVDYDRKKLIVFDLDGTLAPTKSLVDGEMRSLLLSLLKTRPVAIIGGGKYEVFQEQLFSQVEWPAESLVNLFLFPTTATVMYRYKEGWQEVYRQILQPEQKQRIFKAFEEAFKELSYHHPEKIYGELIEDRGTQVSFSGVGQDVVKILGTEKGVALKDQWGKTGWKEKIAAAVQRKLPDLNARAAGYSTIDVTQKGIDKAYGIRQMQKHLNIPVNDMFFIGDAIFPGGNDYAVISTGVDYKKVEGPQDTKEIIRNILSF